MNLETRRIEVLMYYGLPRFQQWYNENRLGGKKILMTYEEWCDVVAIMAREVLNES